ncbi:MAG TPA: PAS domain-containing protein [Flavobacterium sp.]|jgi:PAS domain S-box-containing protein|uniref:sensor histidine kinase n=1 Tax=Flavobacterium sp. TaxID=239 RepID=UPI002B9C5431|nr:PAS domain-containing protein [Flavobacterium sp.]MCA0349743.1 PAS domain-containing protein [Bacteroidota bacterium]HPW97716.1 PAS domain-containing protein [Flavobacterium sp.]HQA74875.1 PAS domain-containing protein [Flavobacterium sp.]
MKSNSNKTTFIFLLLLSFSALGLSFSLSYFNNGTINTDLLFVENIILIVIAGAIFKYITHRNKLRNKAEFENLINVNKDIIEAKERYDIVAKATSDTIWDWRIEEDIMIWNKGIQGVFGYDKKEIEKSSKWWFERIHPEDSLKMSVRLYSFLDFVKDRWQDEYRFRCADGTYKHVIDRGFLIKDKSGKIVRMIGAIQDVSKEKEEEERLRLLETVITNTKIAIAIANIELNETQYPKIWYVNPAFSEITGFSREEVVSKDFSILFNKNTDVLQLENLKNAIKEYRECTFETACSKKDGTPFWISLSMIPVNDFEGRHSHWISIQRDITIEKEKIKEREQLIKELTKNNNDLKQFSYITSHNLRAPLSNLTGLLNLIEDIPIENEDLKEIIDGFANSTYMLNETINDLAKVIIIKDSSAIKKEKILVKDVFENVFNQVSFLINTIKPILKIDLEETYVLNSNKSYLESIFLNLMTNSLKYKSTKRQLKINVTSKVEGDEVIIVFEDNGIGIDMERNKNKIFGLYQRFHNLPDSKGLGLYLVKSQVEAMDGTISVESEVEKGTTFIIKFKNQ